MIKSTVIKKIFDFSPPETVRYGWIDYAKGIAIILVVYRHVEFGLRNSGAPLDQWIIDLNDMLYSFRMPLFFLLSGLFFQRSVLRRGEKGFLLSKVNTLLYPYLLWAFLQISLQMLFPGVVNAERSKGDYINILVQPRSLDQLWYLFALFNVSWLYLFFSWIFKYDNRPQLLISLVFLATAPYLNGISTIYDVMLHYVFFCIGNMAAPYFFSEKVQEKLLSAYGLVLLIPVFIMCQYYFLYHQHMNLFLYAIIALIGSLFVIMLSFQLDKYRVLPFLRLIGHYSLYIYLLHVPIVSFIRYFLLNSGMFSYTPLLLIVLIVIAIVFSVIAYRVCQLLRLNFLFTGPFVTGKRRQDAVAITAKEVS